MVWFETDFPMDCSRAMDILKESKRFSDGCLMASDSSRNHMPNAVVVQHIPFSNHNRSGNRKTYALARSLLHLGCQTYSMFEFTGKPAHASTILVDSMQDGQLVWHTSLKSPAVWGKTQRRRQPSMGCCITTDQLSKRSGICGSSRLSCRRFPA